MSLTMLVALYGAVTGTIGAVVAVRNRADVVWARRAKVVGEARPALLQLRDALAEAKARPERIGAIRTVRLRADLEFIDDVRHRASDRRLRRLLEQAHVACAVLPTAPSGQRGAVTYKADRSRGPCAGSRQRRSREDRRHRPEGATMRSEQVTPHRFVLASGRNTRCQPGTMRPDPVRG